MRYDDNDDDDNDNNNDDDDDGKVRGKEGDVRRMGKQKFEQKSEGKVSAEYGVRGK